MSKLLSRADLLRGRAMPRKDVLRPPPALPEAEFLTLCDGCAKCFDGCPTHILVADDEGRVRLDPTAGMCTFCGSCADVCPTGALDQSRARPWTARAEIRARCLSFNGITCRACEEACDERAIRFKLMTEGRSLPLVDETGCTGCGACAQICPNQSIDLVTHAAEEAVA